MMWPFNVLTEWWDPNSQLAETDISPYFWPNGTMPNSAEYDALIAGGFAGFVLRVGGLVETPRSFSYAELKAMPKQEQITTHFCIQGWSGVAKWGGVPMRMSSTWCAPRPRLGMPCSIHWPRAGGTMTCIKYRTCGTS
jgi:DMSO/TMAO reductase YedYZ molybdopterin-dependent catalytic subunit